MVSNISFIFTPNPGEDSHFDEHIFQMGWNHQPDIRYTLEDKTAGTYKSPMKRKENDLNQTSMIMFHVNLQGCNISSQFAPWFLFSHGSLDWKWQAIDWQTTIVTTTTRWANFRNSHRSGEFWTGLLFFFRDGNSSVSLSIYYTYYLYHYI